MNAPLLSFLEEGMKATTTLCGIWSEVMNNYQARQEAELQQALLAPTGDDARALPRIDRIATAARVFLDHNQALTFFSFLPFMQWCELTAARNFVHAFQKVDHALWRATTERPRLTTWREPQSFRDTFGKLASANAGVYRTIQLIEFMPPNIQQPIVQMLSGQIANEHQRNHEEQQME